MRFVVVRSVRNWVALGCWVGAGLCWGVMLLAGHDVWHAFGSPDFWHGEGLAAYDLRVFAWAFYLLPWFGLGVLMAGCWCAASERCWKRGWSDECGGS